MVKSQLPIRIEAVSSRRATNADGNYSKDRLLPGTYTVEVEAPGFRKAISKDVRVNVDQGSRLDVRLEVGDVTQQVEVSAAAPLLQSDRADVATTFTSAQLEQLPSFDRNAQSYLLLTPGAVKLNGWDHAASENPQGSKQILVNGQHFSGTGYQLDGTENQSPILGIIVINPNLDSLGESKISSQNYDAEFGYAGAGIMNLSTKSGTNDFHGSAFEYLRTNTSGFTDFGRDPFTEPKGPAAVHWNQFGGSVGGALVKNKIFWFGDAQLHAAAHRFHDSHQRSHAARAHRRPERICGWDAQHRLRSVDRQSGYRPGTHSVHRRTGSRKIA